MADYVVTDIDKWLIRNKKDIVDLFINRGNIIPNFKMADYNVIMDRWNSTERTTNTADKLRKWKDLQEKLNDIFSVAKEKIKDYDKQISILNGKSGFKDKGLPNESKIHYDFWSKLNDIGLSRPDASNEELENLDVADVFRYNIRQLKHLASQYGYNYDDPEERKEFITKAGEVFRERELDKIWTDDLYTSLFTPVAKEYARKHYENINSESIPKAAYDLAPALGADFGVNTLMAATPAKFGADLVAAPVVRAGANMVLNDRAPVDAAKEAASEAATNVATPFLLKNFFRWSGRAKDAILKTAENSSKTGAKNVNKVANDIAKAEINKTADKAYDIQQRLKHGAGFIHENGGVYRYTKDGKTFYKVPESELVGTDIVPRNEYEFYLKNKNVLRNKKWGPEADDNISRLERAEVLDTDIEKAYKKGITLMVSKQLNENVKLGKPALEGISAQDLATAVRHGGKETKFNWAKHKAQDALNSKLSENAQSYITNLQGRTQYGGTFINSVAQGIPGLEGKVDLSVKEKPNVANDPELQLIKHLYDLHKKYNGLVPKPRLPKKWEKDYTIEEIFGE